MIKIFFLIYIYFLPTFLFAQSIHLEDSLIKKFETYKKNNFQECIYIHTDRNAYIAGETIWFSVYLTEYGTQQLSDLSKIVYVEILDPQQKAVLQTKIKLKNGLGNGFFSIPTSINSNTFQLRAYSHWMKNNNSDFFYQKDISILNTFKNSGTVQKSDTSAFSVVFLPESDDLVHAISSNIKCQITKMGIPFAGKCFLMNEKNDTLVRIISNSSGLSKFQFTPSKENIYRILTRNEKEIKFVYLPKIATKGIVLSVVEKDSNNLLISIKSTQKEGEFFLFYHVRNQNYAVKKVSLSNYESSISISKNDLIDGVVHFSVFDSQMVFNSECIYIFDKNKSKNLEISIDKNKFIKREKIEINIQNLTKNLSFLSVSVFALDSLNSNSKITNKMLLNEYNEFLNQNLIRNSLNQSKDSVIIYKKWIRFNWKDILNEKNNSPVFVPEIYDHIISAFVRDSVTGLLASNVECFLTFPSKIPQTFISRSDANGKVYFETQQVEGLRDAIFQTYSSSGRKYTIELINPFSENFCEPKKINTNEIKLTSVQSLTQRHIDMQLNAVFYHSNLQNTSINFDTTFFVGKPDEIHNLDNYVRFKTFDEVLTEFVPGMGAKKRKGKYYFQVLDRKNKGYLQDKPLVMLDGVPIFDADSLMKFSPLKVKLISLITNKYYTGKSTWGGVVNFQTYLGDLAGFPISPSWLITEIDGIQAKSVFKTPNEKVIESRKPDFRNLLYWNPEIKLSENQKLKTSFFASDKPSFYKIEVKGTDIEGNILNEELYFEVK